jgi:hypothetical protein
MKQPIPQALLLVAFVVVSAVATILILTPSPEVDDTYHRVYDAVPPNMYVLGGGDVREEIPEALLSRESSSTPKGSCTSTRMAVEDDEERRAKVLARAPTHGVRTALEAIGSRLSVDQADMIVSLITIEARQRDAEYSRLKESIGHLSPHQFDAAWKAADSTFDSALDAAFFSQLGDDWIGIAEWRRIQFLAFTKGKVK